TDRITLNDRELLLAQSAADMAAREFGERHRKAVASLGGRDLGLRTVADYDPAPEDLSPPPPLTETPWEALAYSAAWVLAD
ncbi:hypothetical protein OFB74_34825, partial [Escherichia coli]|nr:hypothetical protein [Escherichia coli]